MLNDKDSKMLAMALLYSTSSEEVIDVLNDKRYKNYFSNAANWAPYGDRRGIQGKIKKSWIEKLVEA